MKKQLQKLILFGSFAFLGMNSSIAQTPTWAWATDTIPAIGGLTTDAAGNVYMAGGFGPDFLMKRDNNGNRIWSKSATGAQDSPPAVANYSDDITLDASGNIFVSGFFTSTTMTLGTTIINRVSPVDMYIAKFDVNGDLLWVKTEAVGNVGNVGYHVHCDGSGNAIVVGSYSAASITVGGTTYTNACTSGGGCPSMLVIKYSGVDGTVLWSKSSFAGIGTTYCYSVDIDNSDNIYVGGDFLPNRNGMVKYNSLGDTLWTNPNAGWYVDVDNSGNLYSGWCKSPSPSDAIVKRYNPATGSLIWASAATGNTNNKGAYLKDDPSGNIYFSGTFRSTSITFGSVTLNHSGGADDDVYIVKLDPSGTVLWGRSFGGNSWDAAAGFAVDGAGNVFADGYFLSSSVAFDATTLNIITALGYNVFYAKLGNNAVTGINNISASKNIFIYPNPANDNLNITGINGKTDIRMYDVLGNVVISTFTPSNMTEEANTALNTSELAQGVYMLVTENNSGRTLTKVVISK